MTTDKLEHDYDTWHHKMSAGGNPIDPLTFPWYNSTFPHIKQYARGNLLELGLRTR